MNFSYISSFISNPQICRKADFLRIINDPAVAANIEAFRNGNANAKKNLPAFCFVSTFRNNKRKSEEAIASGAGMLDLDGGTPERIREIARRCIPAAEETATSPILLVHITPSGKGLRVVYKCTRDGIFANCRKVTDFQKALAAQLDALDLLDGVCHDPARLSFAPKADDVLYLSDRLFTDEAEITEFDKETEPYGGTSGKVKPNPALPVHLTDAKLQDDYDGIPLKEIFCQYLEISGGMPQKGNRNSRFYAAARDLRYICDFNAAVISAHLPDVGLSAGEVFQLCSSACQSSRGSRTPWMVVRAIEICKRKRAPIPEGEDDEEEEGSLQTGKFKYLPSLFREFVKTTPADFKEATLLALLPIIGTLSTRVRAKYLDGETHTPSFFTVVSAEQASGKSFARKLVSRLLRSIAAEDAEQRLIEQQYKEECKRKKNAKDQPEQPRVKVRLVPASISVAKLLQRLDFAEGDHLFSFAEEMDTLIKSNKSGAWSEKSDMYREGFDNATYGQDFLSDSSYSTQVRIFYNLLVLGTPRQCDKFFANVENGLASRICFASIPDQFGAEMPRFETFSERDEKKIDEYVTRLRSANGEINLSFLYPTLDKWLDDQRLLALQENNRARDIFRRRSAVIAFRSVLAIAPLYTLTVYKNRQHLCEFAQMVADIVLRNQMFFAGERLNAVINESYAEPRRVKSNDIYSSLNEEFTTEEVAAALRARGMRTPARTIISKWVTAGMAEKIVKNKYIKSNGTHSETN